MNIKTIALAIAATLSMTAVASADDIGDLITDSYWTGPYVGAMGVVELDSETVDPAVVAGITGYDDGLFYGVEVELSGIDDFESVTGQVTGRAGTVFVDSVAAYGIVGVETDFDSATNAVAGVGTEVRVTDNISLVAEYEHNFPLTSSLPESDEIKIGFKVRF